MSYTVENLEKSMAKITITVDADAFEEAMVKSYNKNKKNISIQGFRKGKAPRKMVEKLYGPEVFYEDAANFAIPDAYEEAAKESGLEIVSRPEIDVVEIEKGKDFVFTATVAVKPEVTLGDYKGIEVEKKTVKVMAADVNAEIDKVREQNSRMITVENRGIKKDDTAVIDFEGFVDGEPFQGGKGEDYSLVIGSHSFIDTFEDQLVGKKAGEEVDVNVTFPEEYHEASLKGKPALFKVTVKEIKKKELPKLDDEFASEVSEFETLKEYKASVKKNLTERRKEEAKREKENEVVEKVVEKIVEKPVEMKMKITEVEPNREQPRKNFDEDALLELAESIKQFGVLQPLLVQKKDDYYEIIAGERRWRAAKLAGLKEVPVIIKDFSDQEVVEIALIENIQREDLNAIEEAVAYKRLMEEFHLKQDEIAERVSKSRTAVTNAMRLLKLDERVQDMLIQDMISPGHARTLLGIEDKDQQYNLAMRIFDEKLSVRDTEKIVKDLQKPKKEEKKKEADPQMEVIYQQLEERIKSIVGTKVAIQHKNKNKGKIEIEYYSQAELERLIDLFESIKES